jgi:transposase-like protein
LNILPKWARRSKSLDALLPALYLRGISIGDFPQALSANLGTDAPNLTPGVISRLMAGWQEDYDRWQARDLWARRYVYFWADGVYLQARMEPEAGCILVIIGVTPEGRKELLGLHVGIRESAQSWRGMLIDIRSRGLAAAPEVAVADLHVIHHAETKAAASAAIKVFTEHEVKHGLATACLTKDAEALLTFFDVPAKHWDHLRISNPPLDDCIQSPAGQRVESVFATVRHPMARTKGALSQKSVKPMAFTLVRAAPKTCRRLTGANQLPRVIEAVKSTDGVANTDPAKTSAH